VQLTFAVSLCLIGAAILLDKWSFGEFGLSQPIIACPLIGLIVGDLPTGLYLGTALQLVWVEALPLGAGRPLDYQAAGVVAAVTCFYARGHYLQQPLNTWPLAQNRVLLASFILGALATIVGQLTDAIVKQVNAGFYRAGITTSSPCRMIAAHLLALVPQYIRGLILTALSVITVHALLPLISRLPSFTRAELMVLPLAIGIASLTDLFIIRPRPRLPRLAWFLAGAVLSVAIWTLSP
jgi:mannose/fructose/N-acetylgalactosamine-specific phosphotransferase system component IIC